VVSRGIEHKFDDPDLPVSSAARLSCGFEQAIGPWLSVEAVPDSPLETYSCLLRALDQLVEETERVTEAGVREWAALATVDAIDLGEELGMMWDDQAELRRPARWEASGTLSSSRPARLIEARPKRCNHCQ
jgi:hypothetical protein